MALASFEKQRETDARGPLIIPAVAAAAVSTATIAATTGAFILGTALSHFLVTTALGIALGFVSSALSGGGIDTGYTLNSTGSDEPHAIIYGERIVGGVAVFDQTTDDQELLHRVIALAGHECSSIESIFFDDQKLTIDGSGNVTAPSRFAGKAKVFTKLGTDGQTAISELVNATSRWTNNHRLRGICYVYCQFKFNRDAYPRGVPTVTAKVRGKKVFDPRNSTTAWSENAALCLRDYLLDGEIRDGD